MKEIQKTPIRLWLASKTAKQHYFVLSENFQINPRAKDYANFVQEYEAHKDQHHADMVRVLSYLTFKELLVVSGVNRRLYIVSGDIDLLKMHSKQKTTEMGVDLSLVNHEFTPGSPVKIKTMQHINASDLREYVYRYQLVHRTSDRLQETSTKSQYAPIAPPSGASGVDQSISTNQNRLDEEFKSVVRRRLSNR